MANKTNDSERFGNYIKALRERLNMTQGELSRRTVAMPTPISRSYISRIESGEVLLPSKACLETLARALSTTVTDLVNWAGYTRPEQDNSDEFSMALNSLKSANLTRAEKEDILLAIEVAMARSGKQKQKAREAKKKNKQE